MLQLPQAESCGVAREVWDSFPDELVFETHVPRDPVFLEATAAGVPIGLLRTPRPPVAHVFENLAEDLERRFGFNASRGNHGPQPLVD